MKPIMKKYPIFARSRVSALLPVVLALTVTGCVSLTPEELKPSEIADIVRSDSKQYRADIEPLTGTLTLEEAMARALKYNADKRLKAMDEAVAFGTFKVGNFDMLPKLVASAGYRDRSNDAISNSRDSVTGQNSLAHPSITSSRQAMTTELGFSWSLLDFGQSYYAARQNADRVLIAQERRRRSQHILLQDVHTAYWRVVASQSLGDAVRRTINEAEESLKDARKVEAERLRNPLEPLRFQLQVLENIKLLEIIDQELSTARIDLASLIGIPFTQSFRVKEPPMTLDRQWLEASAESLEETALMQNAELRESIYNARIARQETRRILLRLFPGLSFNYALKRNDDDYLINKSWNETGLQLSFNLFSLFSAPAQVNLAEAGVAVADQRRIVTQLAVLTQLHVARLNYANALRQFERTDEIVQVEDRIARHVSNQEAVEKQSKQESVARQTSLILSKLRRFQAFSQAQSAISRLRASLGMELGLVAEQDMPLDKLKEEIAKTLADWHGNAQRSLPAPAMPLKPVIEPAATPLSQTPAKEIKRVGTAPSRQPVRAQ